MKRTPLASIFAALAFSASLLGRGFRNISDYMLGGYDERDQRINRKAEIIYRAHVRNRARLKKRTDISQRRKQQLRRERCLGLPLVKPVNKRALDMRGFKIKYNLRTIFKREALA